MCLIVSCHVVCVVVGGHCGQRCWPWAAEAIARSRAPPGAIRIGNRLWIGTHCLFAIVPGRSKLTQFDKSAVYFLVMIVQAEEPGSVAHTSSFRCCDAVISMECEDGNVGVAVTRDGRRCIVSNRRSRSLSVYALPSGSHLMSFGESGSGRGQFCAPAGLCVSKSDTVLVAETHNKRVQEVSLTGEHCRYWGMGVFTFEPQCVATNGDIVAVGTAGGGVYVFDGDSAAFTRVIGEGFCAGIVCGPDPRHITVVDSKARCVSVYFVTGTLVQQTAPAGLTYPTSVAYTEGGDAIVADSRGNRVVVWSAGGGGEEREVAPPAGEPFRYPQALVIQNSRLYVLSSSGGRLHVFS